MRLGLGLGISKSAFVSSITLGQTIAQAHYDRVVADGGVLPVGVAGLSPILDSIIAAYSITSSTDFNTKVPVFLDPSYTGYKLGAGSGTTLGQAAQKVYSVYAGIPQVSDPDAQSFIYRVYTAGGELTTTEANATNQLVLDMKSAGIWTAMKAVYPMVGASAAACAQNLVSSSFTGTFYGGWTYASTGVTPNGTNAYMNTFLNANTNLTNGNFHLSYYSRTNNLDIPYGVEIMLYSAYVDSGWVAMRTNNRLPGLAGCTFGNDTNESISASSTTAGYVIATETASNLRKVFKNNSILGTNTNNSTTAITSSNITFAGNENSFSNNQCAFASLGYGLTDTQASDFYTSVQAFQTTLSRQV
jgi:hypothetical protein